MSDVYLCAVHAKAINTATRIAARRTTTVFYERYDKPVFASVLRRCQAPSTTPCTNSAYGWETHLAKVQRPEPGR